MLARSIFTVGAAALVLLGTPERRVEPPYRIVAVHAQLFYTDRGTLSDDLLARDELGLHNTIIGGGEGDGPSNATLIVVEVAGPAGSFAAERRVELAVRYGKREQFRRQQSLGVLNAKGRGFVGFWLYDTGCEPLAISSALLGQSDPSRHSAKIPFGCSE